MGQIVLNIGAGEKRYSDEGIINVDITPGNGIDIVTDLCKFPWMWEDNSVDGIHLSHVLEHFFDHEKVLRECYRILKPGGFFRIVVPHSTNISSVGCIGHYRTFSCDTLHNYLTRHSRIDRYMFSDIKFKTDYYYINWIWEETKNKGYKDFPKWSRWFLPILDKTINRLIKISPRMFERFWYFLVGGASEVVWKGIKIG